MTALMRRPTGAGGSRALGHGLSVAAALLVATVDADAAPIHRHGGEPTVAHSLGIPAAEVPVFRSWSRYLLAGPSTWSRVAHPLWDSTVRAAVWQSIRTDPGPSDPMVNFLLWKQSLDPPRFAHWHPKLAPALHKIAMARKVAALAPQGPTTTATGPGGGTPTSPGTTPTSWPQDLGPPPVPEPSTLLIAAAMTAWAYRRARRRA
jgi:hypothetical protein